MASARRYLLVVLISSFLTETQGVICLFYHLKADCDYRMDGFAMSRIQATINECNNPVDITFTITCENPKLYWSKTFTGPMDTQEITGYFQRVFLQVKHQYSSKDKKYFISAKVLTESLRPREIMNSTLVLRGETCSLLNKQSQIAISVLGTIVGLAVIAIIVLLIIRRRRNRHLNNQSSPALVENAELPETTLPVRMTSSAETTNQNGYNYENMVTYANLRNNDHQRF